MISRTQIKTMQSKQDEDKLVQEMIIIDDHL